jgi:HK97 gp10 family phage protein
MMATEVTVKMEGLVGVLELLKQLPAEVVSKRGGPVRSALRKGAVVLHKEAKRNLEAVTAGDDTTGLLVDNLVVTRGKMLPGENGEKYLVRVRAKSYQRKGAKVTTRKTASLLEYGSAKQPAEPWLRPAFSSKASEAARTVETELLKGIDRIVKRLSKNAA